MIFVVWLIIGFILFNVGVKININKVERIFIIFIIIKLFLNNFFIWFLFLLIFNLVIFLVMLLGNLVVLSDKNKV